MTAIVMNTATGAVTEYPGWEFQSLTPAHAGSAKGLYLLGGDTDAGVPIASEISTGLREWGTSLKKYVRAVYFSLRGGQGDAQAVVGGPGGEHAYTFPLRSSGVSRCVVGRGVRENYLSFALKTAGQAFELDSVEAEIVQSTTRRV